MNNKVVQSDVLEGLRDALNAERPGTADSDVNIFALPTTVTRGLIDRAIREIERLRLLADDLVDTVTQLLHSDGDGK